jgi:hypothetical protein
MTSLNVSPPEAKNALAAHVAGGKELVLAAAMVGDPDDFDVWTERCRRWTARIGSSLEAIYGEEASTVFQHSTAAAKHTPRWQDALAAEVERAQHVIEMLISLSDGVR